MFSSYKSYETGYGHTVQEFGGLNERKRIGENEFAKIENMTLQEYPLLAVRDKRLTLSEEEDCVCLYHRGSFVKIKNEISGYVLYVDGQAYKSVKLTDENGKKIIGMGAYALILPDKVYVNLAGPRFNLGLISSISWGYVDAECAAEATFEPCTINGEIYNAKTIGNVEPSNPQNGDVWVDTSKKQSTYKVWDNSMKQWTGVGTTYIKIKMPSENMSGSFAKWDAANILVGNALYGVDGSELSKEQTEKLTEQLWQLNSQSLDSASILFDAADEDGVLTVIVAGIIDFPFKAETTISRTMPEVKYMFEHNNRMWGCVFSEPKLLFFSGKNEVVSSKQGDLKNWKAYLGVSSDSYAATIGAPGEFTGGVSYGGYPMFFKEDCIIKVYGDTPASYQVVTTPGMGVEKGMHESLVVAGNILFYKSPGCFCAYDGSAPVNISSKLKNKKYKSIKAGATDSKVYFACEEAEGDTYMLVFEIETGVWSKESCGTVGGFIRQGASLNYTEINTDEYITAVRSVGQDYDAELLQALQPVEEDDVSWFCESGELGLGESKLKYAKKIVVKAKIKLGATMRIMISCDGKDFEQAGDKIITPGIVTVSVPIIPECCESFRYRLEGKGYVEIYSVSYELKEGSDKR